MGSDDLLGLAQLGFLLATCVAAALIWLGQKVSRLWRKHCREE